MPSHGRMPVVFASRGICEGREAREARTLNRHRHHHHWPRATKRAKDASATRRGQMFSSTKLIALMYKVRLSSASSLRRTSVSDATRGSSHASSFSARMPVTSSCMRLTRLRAVRRGARGWQRGENNACAQCVCTGPDHSGGEGACSDPSATDGNGVCSDWAMVEGRASLRTNQPRMSVATD